MKLFSTIKRLRLVADKDRWNISFYIGKLKVVLFFFKIRNVAKKKQNYDQECIYGGGSKKK